MSMGYYKLVNKKPVPATVDELESILEDGDSRKVAVTCIGIATVSTVFLGLDHSFGDTTPILFETLVFGGLKDGYMLRYATWEEAENGHKDVVKEVMECEGIHDNGEALTEF